MRILTADHVLPVSSGPIENGAVAVDGTVIAAVGTLDEVSRAHPGAPVEDLGEAAIIPGLVNCHSHLEITAMRGYLDAVEHDFRAWLLKLNKTRQDVLSPEDIAAAAIAGAVEGARAGVTCFGDIGRGARAGLEALKTVGLRGVAFQETEFSPDNATADSDFEKLREKFDALAADATDLVRAGISPHSPYTVSARLFAGIARFAASAGVPVTIHTAESTEETELMKNGRGFFIEVYKKFGLEWEVPGCSPVEFLSRTGILENRPLLVHCVEISAEDLLNVEQNGAKIAHCPKSNAKFGHGTAPLEKFLDAGVKVGLGSDSVASNNTCDLLEESRFAALFARNRPGSERFISAQNMLEIATLGGAEALGLDRLIGTLEVGKQADITAVSLARVGQKPVTDLCSALIFASGAADVILTMVAGREIFRGGTVSTVDESEVRDALGRILTKLGLKP